MQTTAKSLGPQDDLPLIHRYTRREFAPEELYAFSLVLCDNEIDRDGERFTIPALRRLAELFVGKTGIFDHEATGKNQAARVYAAEVCADSARTTEAGEPYTWIKARAYMVRTRENEGLIGEIEGGIKKEVSVGCSVAKRICSICKAETRPGEGTGCSHEPGRRYDGALCHRLLDEPTDAYEWSFVAVPAQRAAGVTKGRKPERKEAMTDSPDIQALAKRFASCGGPITLTQPEARALADELAHLQKDAALGLAYREELAKEVRRLAFLAGETIDAPVLEAVVKKLDIPELKAFCASYEARLASGSPGAAQLAGGAASPGRSPADAPEEFRMR